jgi:coenzyme PQQ precursor peptide PqqA
MLARKNCRSNIYFMQVLVLEVAPQVHTDRRLRRVVVASVTGVPICKRHVQLWNTSACASGHHPSGNLEWHGYCVFPADCKDDGARRAASPCNRNEQFNLILEEITMAWSKPEFIDWRFGFEITLYIAKR